MKKYVALIFAVAMMIFVAPAMEVQAAAPAAPKDAEQDVSIETGIRVSWKAVAGATQYYYSFSSDDKTYTAESLTGNGGKDTFVNVVNKDVMKPGTIYYVKIRAFNGSEYSEAVKVKAATAPLAPKKIEQTAATSTSVTLTWDASAGATGYQIRFGTTAASAKDIQKISTTSCKLTGLAPDSKYYVAIYPVIAVSKNFYASQNCVDNPKVVTTAAAVKSVKLTDWDVKTNTLMFSWDNSVKYESGYELELAKTDGTVIKTYPISGRRAKIKALVNKKVKNTPFKYRMRSYTTFAGVKNYGEWSAYGYAIPQANVTATKVSDTAVQLKWDKVAGAKSYTVYRATKEGGKYKKIATVKKTKYKAKKLKTYKDYYFYVKANKVSIDGKSKGSTALEVPNYINVYIYKYQDKVSAE